jgi:hypothetical protein
MGVAKVKTSIDYMFDLSKVEYLMPIDHKYQFHVFAQLGTSCSSSYAHGSKEGGTKVHLAPLYEESFGTIHSPMARQNRKMKSASLISML